MEEGRRGEDHAKSCVYNCSAHLWMLRVTEVSLAFPKCAFCGRLVLQDSLEKGDGVGFLWEAPLGDSSRQQVLIESVLGMCWVPGLQLWMEQMKSLPQEHCRPWGKQAFSFIS